MVFLQSTSCIQKKHRGEKLNLSAFLHIRVILNVFAFIKQKRGRETPYPKASPRTEETLYSCKKLQENPVMSISKQTLT